MTYLFDKFVNTEIGDGYRLFPFGKVVKSGKVREITPEYARQFKLPHFKPAIKLGSHEDATPAGGHIVSLEVRDDGLYAIPEWNEQGLKALNDGAYRYQSPEVIWSDGGLEHPETGEIIEGPLILGDALLHTPHLGDKAAMYSVETNKEKKMQENMIPDSAWEKFTAFLDAKLKGMKPETVEIVPDDYEVTKKQRDEYAAKLEAIEAEKLHTAKVEKYSTELTETKADPEMAELLANVPEETADLIMKQFRALSEQINESELTEEKGTEGTGAELEPKAAFNALVVAHSAEKKIGYNDAFTAVKAENPDLFAQAFAK
jgi:phage I-like protein